MRKRLPTLDREAALRATAFALAAALCVLALQGVVTAAVTDGTQPMAAVETVPTSPDAAAWDDAPSRAVTLEKQQMAVPVGGGSVSEMDVKALTNESHVAFRLSWPDPTNDTSIGAPGNYSDAAAIMLHSGETPPIMMGGAGTPVNIWYWRSSWRFGEKSAPWSGDMYSYPHPHNESMPGRMAANPLARADYEQFAHNYYARGYGSLSHAPKQPVTAQATRRADGWTVTFTRERGTNGTFDAGFERSEPMYLAFAVWNGSAREVNGQKSLTMTFTELDLTNGTLDAADTGSAADSGTSGSASADADDSGSWVAGTLGTWVSALIGATLLTWLVVYWRGL